MGYLQIKGVSRFSTDVTYDERYIPPKLRLPYDQFGRALPFGERPNLGKYYPEIAVPLELAPRFAIEAGQNQSIWCDIYIPKDAPAGLYSGRIIIREAQARPREVPVFLTVKDFTLADQPSAKTMVYMSRANIF